MEVTVDKVSPIVLTKVGDLYLFSTARYNYIILIAWCRRFTHFFRQLLQRMCSQ